MMPQFRPPCEPETPEERDARRKLAFAERQAHERDVQAWNRQQALSAIGPRRGRCSNCQMFTTVCCPPFPSLAFVVFACLTFIPRFFIGGTSGWFAIGFAWWRFSEAVCTHCGGRVFSQRWARMSRGESGSP